MYCVHGHSLILRLHPAFQHCIRKHKSSLGWPLIHITALAIYATGLESVVFQHLWLTTLTYMYVSCCGSMIPFTIQWHTHTLCENLVLKCPIQFSIPGSPILVHDLQMFYLHQLVQSRLYVEENPLVDCYQCLHTFCLALQLDCLNTQVTSSVYTILY